ncbi:MAG TPA: hypothetical protein VKS60_03080 [Stellaceae bacterium]|nr:hypothetical protein [Stellaceae bacterium]
MQTLILAALLATAPVTTQPSPLVLVDAPTPTQFDALADAQKHCPGDTIVWVNLYTKIYHDSNSKMFGKSSNGKYACLGEVSKNPDYRPSPTGR